MDRLPEVFYCLLARDRRVPGSLVGRPWNPSASEFSLNGVASDRNRVKLSRKRSGLVCRRHLLGYSRRSFAVSTALVLWLFVDSEKVRTSSFTAQSDVENVRIDVLADDHAHVSMWMTVKGTVRTTVRMTVRTSANGCDFRILGEWCSGIP